MDRNIIVIAHNIRSTYNVGAIFRTADGFGVEKIVLSGYTPYPRTATDPRLPHLSQKLTRQIHKTALGAENTVAFEYTEEPIKKIQELKKQGYVVAGLEQDTSSIMLSDYTPPNKIALLLGEEVTGIPTGIRKQCDVLLEIPMRGKKESFNVSVATGIALYALSSRK